MSNTAFPDLEKFSDALVHLVAIASRGVVAVKSAAYRTASGILLSDGLVAVASSMLRREGKIPVRFFDGADSEANILGRDSSIDLAILKLVDARPGLLPLADPSSLKAGMLAVIVGMTNDVGPSASVGIIGAVGPARRTWRGGTLDSFLRLDVNLYPSQAGAAVVDVAGDLLGLASPNLSRHAAIAVPAVTLERVSQEILRSGRIRHGYLGVGVQPVPITGNLSKDLSIEAKSGLILLSVEEDSPAEKAGLQIGDILFELDGKPIADVDELQEALRGEAVGKVKNGSILRGGKLQTVTILVGERQGRGRRESAERE